MNIISLINQYPVNAVNIANFALSRYYPRKPAFAAGVAAAESFPFSIILFPYSIEFIVILKIAKPFRNDKYQKSFVSGFTNYYEIAAQIYSIHGCIT